MLEPVGLYELLDAHLAMLVAANINSWAETKVTVEQCRQMWSQAKEASPDQTLDEQLAVMEMLEAQTSGASAHGNHQEP
jgi:hypothetical protein